MRTAATLQRAHDLLVGLVLDEVPLLDTDATERLLMQVSLNVLCWALEHAHAEEDNQFGALVAELEEQAVRVGFELTDVLPDGVPADACEQCHCTEQRGCPEGCSWSATFRAVGRHVCSRCFPIMLVARPPVVIREHHV